MAKPRKRYDKRDKPLPCTVTLSDELSPYLYQERRRGKYKDETELVAAIVREWSKTQPDPDWAALLAELKAEEESKSEATGPKARAKRPGKDKKAPKS